MPIYSHNPLPSGGYRVQFKEGATIYDYRAVLPEDVQAIQQADIDDVAAVIRRRLVNGGYEFVRVDPNQPEGEGSMP